MATKAVRISDRSYQRLHRISEQEHVKMGDLVDEAVRKLDQERYARRFNEGYARLRQDPQAWAEEEEERRAWDQTLADGLHDEY